MIKTNEQGVVSILVTFVIMIVISITVLGFAQVIRREQRQALDNQLSSQAFYAAETGVNDALKIINANLGNPTALAKTDCPRPASGIYKDLNYDIDATNKYTCLLVDPTPRSLKVPISTGSSSKVVAINPVGTLQNLTLEWTPDTSVEGSPLDGCSSNQFTDSSLAFTPQDSWACNGYGVLRIDLVPTDGSLTRSGLVRNNFTAFIMPTTSSAAGDVDYRASSGAAAIIANAKCSAASCVMNINVKPVAATKYYMRIMPLYRAPGSDLEIKGDNDTTKFANSQVLIDSTGKSQDILRRIQVRVPISNTSADHADYGLQSSRGICKQFSSYYNNTTPAEVSYSQGFSNIQNVDLSSGECE